MAELLALPIDQEGPVFNAPWQAHAFALAVKLHEGGHFTWSEWAQALATEIKQAQGEGDPDRGDTYYEHWLNALEKLITQKGITDLSSLTERREDWRRAYLNTPHGQPISLQAAVDADDS